ncbi:MAG: flagellar basal body rod protein FlgB [Ignavibacterium sp.]|jgi:flagellar basal-body rod protein FlgB|nr:flagellar basal body rod protein FlgB [Ignavibacterium sp.]
MQPSGIKSLEKFIDYCSLKNKVISKNIANIGTENYKREDVSFKEVLNNLGSMKATNPKHIKLQEDNQLQFEFSKDKSLDNASGVNNVDIDKEMSELAANSIQFRFASRKIGDYYRGLQNVIKGGGKL